jgi:hypothetical protein
MAGALRVIASSTAAVQLPDRQPTPRHRILPYPALRASPRLVLRDFIDEDWADAHALRSDPDVARFMDHAPETLEQSRVRLTGVIFHDRKRSHVGMVHLRPSFC